ncbi:aspartic peptidase A1 [Fomitiporia mediterranea MF3/22]|uniref:aspartic peptidase A1 n=1 Tax=Fomitiporia mediterranea (strain MF3/22) TaxID=694068 RepID=UPI0004407C75|nr:aspartic peptidase A1 [Fomitiporia mediterranea MF3/22]EJC99835.1 aspartic peptidase A1 [Fomitiporia mediterranea MF3/22]
MLVYTLALLATLVAAAPPAPAPLIQVHESPVSLALTRRVNSFNASGPNLAERDRARAKHQFAVGKSLATNGKREKRQGSLAVTDQTVIYTAEVGVGSPPTNYSLIMDTGSSNTWVGADKPYNLSNPGQPTGKEFTIVYGSGFVSGLEFTDTVTLTNELVITSQTIGSALAAGGFQGVDGILGIGPIGLTEGTEFPSITSKVPTVTDNLFSQGKIPQKVVGIYFAPTTSQSDTNGEMTFGGADTSRTAGPITFAPITSTSPSSEFFGIDQSISYGSGNADILSSTAGIVDTGTTLTLLATDAYNKYTTMTGATHDDNTGLLKITPDDYAELKSLFFSIAGTTFEFTKNAQTWPRALNAAIGGTSDGIYLIIGDLGEHGGSGLDFISGMTFLERFYSVFDSTNNRVGLATTAHTFDETN